MCTSCTKKSLWANNSHSRSSHAARSTHTQQGSVNLFVQSERVIVFSILTMWNSSIKVWKCYQEMYLSNEDFNGYLCAWLLHSWSSTLHLISGVGNNPPANRLETQGDQTGCLLQKMAKRNQGLTEYCEPSKTETDSWNVKREQEGKIPHKDLSTHIGYTFICILWKHMIQWHFFP